MPKQLKELKNFMGGISSNVSPSDIDAESATYSLNINNNSTLGRMEGSKKNKILTTAGFQSEGNVGVDEINIDFTKFVGVWHGNVLSAEATLSASVPVVHRLDSMYTAKNGTSTTNVNTMNWYKAVTPWGPNEISMDGNPQAIWVFDTLGTLQYFIVESDQVDQEWIKLLHYNGLPSIRHTGANIANTSKIFGFNSSSSQLFSPIHPYNSLVQIRLDGKEWLFRVKDTDASSANPSPLIVDMAVFPIETFNGVASTSSAWADEIQIVDVELDLNAITANTTDRVDTYLEAIQSTINSSGKGTCTIEGKSIKIIPSNLNAYNDVRCHAFSNLNKPTIQTTISFEKITFNTEGFVSVPNPIDKAKTNIISINNSQILKYDNIFSVNPTSNVLYSGLFSTELDINAHSDKVIIGTGGTSTSIPKIAINTKANSLLGSTVDAFTVEDFNLDTYERPAANDVDGESVIFPIYGSELDGGGGILFNNADEANSSNISEVDWDFLYDGDPVSAGDGNYLWEYINDYNIQVGQIIKIETSGNDTDAAEFTIWKKFDYEMEQPNGTAQNTKAGDLFLFAGYTQSNSPIMRYIGNQGTTGGTPAFSYHYSPHSTKITKVSLSAHERDSEAFSTSVIGQVKYQNDSGGSSNETITSSGSRVHSVSVASQLDAMSNSNISSLGACTSPLLFNNFGLPGENTATSQPFDYASSNIFKENGNLKFIFRHGIFWVALSQRRDSIYRVNLMDFHDLSNNGLQFQEINLDYSNLPLKLANNYTENDWSSHPEGEGCININIPDQHYKNQSASDPITGDLYLEDGDAPQDHPWSNVPLEAEIVGICETYECGRITGVNDEPFIWGAEDGAYNAYEFTARPCDTNLNTDNTTSEKGDNPVKWSIRLTTGDKIMITGMKQGSNETEDYAYTKFNIPSSGLHEVNMVDTNKFIIDAPEASIAALNDDNVADNKSLWWNSKVWILYAKKNDSQHFSKWDLFLYNANTMDLSASDLSLKMADRTVPYSEAGYYEDTDGNSMYYPRQFAHLMDTIWPNAHEDVVFTNRKTDSQVNDSTYGINLGHKSFYPNGWKSAGVSVDETSFTSVATSWGIYDKSGRWSVNGGLNWVHEKYWLQSWNPIADSDFGLGEIPIDAASSSFIKLYSPTIPGRGDKHTTAYDSSVQNFGDFEGNFSAQDVWTEDDGLSQGVFATAFGGWGGKWVSNGKLFWGHNIGWDSRKPRKIQPISHSLVPLTHYSSCFLAGRLVHGSNGYNKESFNLPKHAISFLGKVDGTFVKRPSTLERMNAGIGSMVQHNGLGNQPYTNLSSNDPISSFGGVDQLPLRPFMINNKESHSTNSSPDETNTQDTNWDEGFGDLGQLVEDYGDSTTLFELDEWTGHPGIVYRNINEGPTPSQTDYGVVRGRPNFGGPEIENPNFKSWVRYSANQTYSVPANNTDEMYAYNYWPQEEEDETTNGDYRYHRMNWTHGSNNFGFYNGESWTDKGWGGYKPPSLFNPGKGYYVFINRTWKTASNRTTFNGKEFCTVQDANGVSQNVPDASVWNFQFYEWPHDGLDVQNTGIDNSSTVQYAGRRLEKSANRWNNFSSTAIADASFLDYNQDKQNSRLAYKERAFNSSQSANIQIYDNDRADRQWISNKYVARSLKYDSDGTPSYIDDGTNIQFNVHANNNLDETQSDSYLKDQVDCVFKTGVGFVMGPVCTMHRIDADTDIDRINNVSHTLLKNTKLASFVNHDEDINVSQNNNFDDAQTGLVNNEYVSSYILGVKTKDNNPGILIVNNNLSTIFAKDAKRTLGYEQFGDKFNGTFREMKLFSSYTSGINPYINQLLPINLHRKFNFHNRDSWAYETAHITHLNNVTSNTATGFNTLKLRLSAFKEYNNSLISDNIKVFDNAPYTTLTEDGADNNGLVSPVATDSKDFWYTVTSKSLSKDYFVKKNNMFDVENRGQDIFISGVDSQIDAVTGDTGGFFKNDILDSVIDSDIRIDANSNVIITPGITNLDGIIDIGVYQYKITLEYDSEFESALQEFDAYTYEVFDGEGFESLKIKISFSPEYLQSLSRRVSGISIYRSKDENDAYKLINTLPFNSDDWSIDERGYFSQNVEDRGPSITYDTYNGISQDLQDTSFNFGLSTIYRGYMFVSHVWHKELKDVSRYIFRSIPNNYFRYDWENEYCILPEVPIAMTNFNSRLYVWGKNKLYKIDPMSLLIEDEYEGISIASKHSFVRTEFGLCFLDINNVYLHDGNKPNPIANQILNPSSYPVDYSGNKLQSSYKELIKSTLSNGHTPNVFFLNKETSFAINLSNSNNKGRLLTYNIASKRWDLRDSPIPIGVSSSSDGTVLISDSERLYNFGASDDEIYHTYDRHEWDWHSKEFTLGAETQDKVFLGLNMTGTLSYYKIDTTNAMSASTNTGNSIRVYIDGDEQSLEIQNKRYSSTRLLSTTVGEFIYSTDNSIVISSISDGLSPGVEDDYNLNALSTYDNTTKQEFIRPGHYIKIHNEIMFVNKITSSDGKITLSVDRAQLGTLASDLSVGNEIYVINPRLRIKNNRVGKKMKVVLEGQRGYLDSIGLIYKNKGIK